MKQVQSSTIAEYSAVIMLTLSLLCVGGYFISVSCFIAILLLFVLLALNWKDKGFYLPFDINAGIISLVCLLYFLSALWGIDAGMSVIGGFKFLPLALFFVLLHYPGVRRTRMIEMLPMIGTIMTILTFVMMRFDVFAPYVSVAGRLAGTFQYPNTYAIFMLICLIIAFEKLDFQKPDWLYILYCIALIAGIILSGTRAVFVLTVITAAILVMRQKQIRKVAGISFLVVVIAIVGISFSGIFGDVFSRLTDISIHSSTLLGRILYWKDAVTIILKHPFGAGYYGYYYLQQQFQTGVYSVVNVHNDFLQLMLDIGIVPAILFYGMGVRQILKKSTSFRDRLILTMLLLHSLFDYDFQFLSILFVLLLFLDVKEVKRVDTSGIGRAAVSIVSVLLVALSGIIGYSNLMYTQGHYEIAIRAFSGNTAAKVSHLVEVEDVTNMREVATSIANHNEHVSIAYSALARAAYADGDIETFMKYKLKAIHLAPYQFDEYLDYMNSLYLSFQSYMDDNDKESAKVCLLRMEQVPQMLKELEENTSSLAWEINDTPQVTLPIEYTELIETMRGQLDE